MKIKYLDKNFREINEYKDSDLWDSRQQAEAADRKLLTDLAENWG